VVQAHSHLFQSDPKNKSACGMVLLYTLDDAHRFDKEWLAKTANRILEMKQIFKNQPETGIEKMARLMNFKDNFLYSITLGSAQKKKKAKVLPEDCRGFIRTLSLDAGSFGIKLGETLGDGADAYCATYSVWDQSKLPDAKIPQNKIIPILIIEQSAGGSVSDSALLIPTAYYTK
jgi:hypothetical protein